MSDLNSRERVEWPARAVVTAGMPYGNKPLHFGHIGGVFVPADAFARFLRDRIGAENVRFVSGTDCFGSPINEGYRKLKEAGEFEGSIADYVLANHERQKATLEAFQVSLDIYEGSGIGHAGDVHQMISDQFIERLHESGHLKLDSTLQFYDAEAGTFLNGRQVQGHCPVQGCKSEHAYADECDLGHQYAPVDLIAPVSTLTGTVPEMRPVENWYFDLPGFEDFLKGYVRELEADDEVRLVVTKAIAEFLAPPVIFVKNEHLEEYEAMAAELPPHEFRPAEGNKQSFEIEFASIGERDAARDVLAAAGLRFRTSKTLVPFRITGNIEWGVRAPSSTAWRGSRCGAGPNRCGRPSRSPSRSTTSRGCRARAGATSGAPTTRGSTSSSARTTCTSTVWPSRRCGRLCAPAACSPRAPTPRCARPRSWRTTTCCSARRRPPRRAR